MRIMNPCAPSNQSTHSPQEPGAKTNTTRQTWNGIVVTRAVVTHMCASQICCQRESKRTQECHWQHSTVKSITLMKTDCANCTAVATSHAQSQVGDTPWVTQSINRGCFVHMHRCRNPAASSSKSCSHSRQSAPQVDYLK